MSTYSTNGPGGSFDFVWNGSKPPTEDQFGSILAYNNAVPVSNYSDPNAKLESSVQSDTQNYSPNTSNQNVKSPYSSNQTSAQPTPQPMNSYPGFSTTGSNGPLSRNPLSAANRSAGQPSGQMPFQSTTARQPTGPGMSTGPSSPTLARNSTDLSSNPPADNTGLLGKNRNSPSYYDLLGIGDTIAGQPSGVKPNQSRVSGRPSDNGLPTGVNALKQDYGSDDPSLFADAHAKHVTKHARKYFAIQPQTITKQTDGSVLITNTALNVDTDGRGGYPKGDPQTSIKLDGDYPDPGKIPYLVSIDMPDAKAARNANARDASNYGIRPRDFGVVALPTGEIAGGVFADGGHSLVGEASIAVHKLLGNNPGPDYTNRLEKSSGVRIVAFPGSGAAFAATGLPYTEKNIQIYSLYLYMTHGYTTRSMMLTGSDPMDVEALAPPVPSKNPVQGGKHRGVK